MTRKGYLYNVIFKTCSHLDQTENYETTSHVYLQIGDVHFWAILGPYYRYVVPFTGEESVCRGEGHTFGNFTMSM